MSLGSRFVWLTGVVQEEHQRYSPGQHGVPCPHQHPWAEQRPERHGLGPRLRPPGRSARKAGPWGSGNAGIGGSALGAEPERLRETVYWLAAAAPQANRCRWRAGPARAQYSP